MIRSMHRRKEPCSWSSMWLNLGRRSHFLPICGTWRIIPVRTGPKTELISVSVCELWLELTLEHMHLTSTYVRRS